MGPSTYCRAKRGFLFLSSVKMRLLVCKCVVTTPAKPFRQSAPMFAGFLLTAKLRSYSKMGQIRPRAREIGRPQILSTGRRYLGRWVSGNMSLEIRYLLLSHVWSSTGVRLPVSFPENSFVSFQNLTGDLHSNALKSVKITKMNTSSPA